MVTYVLAMAFILVYGGEHFAFDILTGWLYAITVTAGFALATPAHRTGALARWWASVQPAPILETLAPGRRRPAPDRINGRRSAELSNERQHANSTGDA
jgi:hypothetical protein